jgi:hypothetical protein
MVGGSKERVLTHGAQLGGFLASEALAFGSNQRRKVGSGQSNHFPQQKQRQYQQQQQQTRADTGGASMHFDSRGGLPSGNGPGSAPSGIGGHRQNAPQLVSGGSGGGSDGGDASGGGLKIGYERSGSAGSTSKAGDVLSGVGWDKGKQPMSESGAAGDGSDIGQLASLRSAVHNQPPQYCRPSVEQQMGQSGSIESSSTSAVEAFPLPSAGYCGIFPATSGVITTEDDRHASKGSMVANFHLAQPAAKYSGGVGSGGKDGGSDNSSSNYTSRGLPSEVNKASGVGRSGNLPSSVQSPKGSVSPGPRESGGSIYLQQEQQQQQQQQQQEQEQVGGGGGAGNGGSGRSSDRSKQQQRISGGVLHKQHQHWEPPPPNGQLVLRQGDPAVPPDGIFFAQYKGRLDTLVVYRSAAERASNPERLNLDRRQLTCCPILKHEDRVRLLNYQNVRGS